MANAFIQKLRTVFGLSIQEDTDLEVWCKAHYPLIPNFAYDQKRTIEGKPYAIFLNECVTSRAYMVTHSLLKGASLSGTRLSKVRSVGNVIARTLTWTDDKNLSTSGDYYLMPCETIALRAGDCEDHAFVTMSSLPDDVGGAWGSYNGAGHAYNVLVDSDTLWVVDTVGDSVVMLPYEQQSTYKINYIITQKYTFAVDPSTNFGVIAGWDT